MEPENETQRRVVQLGGKTSTLSPAAVFDIANGLSQVAIDSSSVSKASRSSNSSAETMFSLSIPDYLTPEESRASILLLLNKLILSSSSPTAISQLLNLLNTDSAVDSRSLEINLSSTDASIADFSVAVLEGISALLDYRSSCLAVVSDAVAAISCEAIGAGVSAFNVMDSGDGSSGKDEVSVAADFRVFFNDSKLVNVKVLDPTPAVSNIPVVHGRLREIYRLLHSSTRVGLSSGLKFGAADALSTNLLALASAVSNLAKYSLSRAKLVINSIPNVEFHSILEARGSNSCNLKVAFASCQVSLTNEDYMKFSHQVFSLVEEVRKIISWEATVAFVALEGCSLIENTQNDRTPISDKRSDKKKKVLGRGSSALILFIKEKLGCADLTKNPLNLLEKWSQDFSLLLDPKHFGYEALYNKVKEIVESNENRRRPKLPKGTRDFAKKEMIIRERAFAIITEVFKRHGATALDTPVFELRETLTGKYGEDSKLIYDLADQGGELCSLRYDLTVPFARYVAMNGLTSFKRYQIAKVYRRDNPAKGRYREFYQCDFDIAGHFQKMGPDFEVIKILTELLNELDIGEYEVKLNHRKLLDGMLAICGVPAGKFRTICSSIDKLDKQSFEQIKREMVDEKGLSSQTADAIGVFVRERGSPLTLLHELKKEGSKLLDNPESLLALNELEILFKALEKSSCVDKVVFDLSLARGLDYYTGVIFEAVFKGSTQVGTIAAGGRYDNLIGMFGSKQVPSVGISLGIERVFAIMEQLQKDSNQVIATETDVLVSVLGEDLSLGAELVSQLWDAKLKAECMVDKRMKKHTDALESGIPWWVIVGERELNSGMVKLKNVKTKEEMEIPRSRFVEEVSKRLNGVPS